MLKRFQAIENVATRMKDFKEGKNDPDCFVTGLTPYENTRLSQIKFNCLTAENLIGLSYFVIGESLIEAKAILKTKDAFEEWVNKNCNFRIRTAYNTITAVLIVREFPSLKNLDKQLLYYMGTRTFPKKLKQIIADHQVGELNLTKVDLMALESAYLSGEITEDSDTVIKHLKKQNNVDVSERWLVETNKLIKKFQNDLSKIKEMKSAQERVVGKNQTVRKCSKTLEDCLSEAIKKCEDFAKKIEGKSPLENQNVQVGGAPIEKVSGKPGLLDLANESVDIIEAVPDTVNEPNT